MPKSRLLSIDALRGIAALLVVWQHSAESFIKTDVIAQQGTLLADMSKTLDFGRIGIMCFFLISGFVIPFSFNSKNPQALRNFTIRRFLRLYPAYWFSLFSIIVVNIIMGIEVNTNTAIANTTMLQSFFAQHHLVGLYWTLQIELVFYLICGLLFYYGLLYNNKVIFSIILLCFTFFTVVQLIINFTDINLEISKSFQFLPYLISTMFLGAFYRKIYDGQETNNNLIMYTKLSSLMCLGLPIVLLLSSIMGFELVNGAFRFGISHVLAFILFFIGIKFFNKVPKLLLFLGAISYSLYLFHPIVLKLIMYLLSKSENTTFQGLHVSIYMAVTTIISVLIAVIVYKTIEKPAIHFAHKLSK